MDTIQPTIRIDFEDGTSSNVTRVGSLRENKALLEIKAFFESISGLKYGRKAVDTHTFRILKKLKETISIDDPIMNGIIEAAETLLVSYYMKNQTTSLYYDEERDEFIVYMKKSKDFTFDSVVRVTLMIRNIIFDYNLTHKDLFVCATLDIKNLVDNLKYFENECARVEDYTGAALIRDVIKEIEILINKRDDLENNRNKAA